MGEPLTDEAKLALFDTVYTRCVCAEAALREAHGLLATTAPGHTRATAALTTIERALGPGSEPPVSERRNVKMIEAIAHAPADIAWLIAEVKRLRPPAGDSGPNE